MKKIKFSSMWLLVLAIPFEITAIILFASKASIVLGSVFLCLGVALYTVGIFLSRKEGKAEETLKNNAGEKIAADEKTEEKAE